ncbi:MAG: hypothetical protein P1U86_03590 [Verrucomicrobiales bacterium]|nr:hypothetical protein [Verrucomicrobiales bacterium]
MNTPSLTDRIRKVRLGARAQQPLKYRIELVRSRSKKSGNGDALKMQGTFEHSN